MSITECMNKARTMPAGSTVMFMTLFPDNPRFCIWEDTADGVFSVCDPAYPARMRVADTLKRFPDLKTREPFIAGGAVA